MSLADRLVKASKAYDTRAFQAGASLGLPMTRPLVDNTRLGSFWLRHQVAIDTTDTALDIKLGRIPSCYIVLRSSGGVVYDGSDPSVWTGDSITLRATVAGTYSVAVG